MRTSGAFVRLQRLDMEGIFDLLGAIEAAGVISDRLVALDDAHPLERGEYLHLPTDVSMWERDYPVTVVNAGVPRRTLHAHCDRDLLDSRATPLPPGTTWLPGRSDH